MRRRLSSEIVGPAVRKLRLAKDLTLADLSERTGVPLSTLSKLELGQAALTYDKLIRLCRALEVDLERTMTREAEGAPVATGRRARFGADDGEVRSLGPHAARFAAADLLSKAMTPVFLDVSVSDLAAHGPFQHQDGEVLLLVLSGGVELHSEIYAPLGLAEGEGVYLDGRAGFALLASPGHSARVLMVASGDIEG
jgi:transcriptional regulator with XRE-family HTH domain